jgi:hypothetical protein
MVEAWKLLQEPHERLKWARTQRGFADATAAAEALGVKAATYLGHENGSRGITRAARRYAEFFRVSYEWLMTGKGSPKRGVSESPRGRVDGYVGAGAEVVPVDDSSLGDEIELPPGAPANTHTLIVRGNSMYPRYFEGEHLSYVPEPGDPEQLIGRECVVKLRDGRVLVKIIRRGSRPRCFNLESWNAPPLEDQQIEWAAPVRWRG